MCVSSPKLIGYYPVLALLTLEHSDSEVIGLPLKVTKSDTQPCLPEPNTIIIPIYRKGLTEASPTPFSPSLIGNHLKNDTTLSFVSREINLSQHCDMVMLADIIGTSDDQVPRHCYMRFDVIGVTF